MRIGLFITLALIYLLGTVTVKWLDSVLPREYSDSWAHYPALFTMWICSPLLILWFIAKFFVTFFKNFTKR